MMNENEIPENLENWTISVEKSFPKNVYLFIGLFNSFCNDLFNIVSIVNRNGFHLVVFQNAIENLIIPLALRYLIAINSKEITDY